MIDLIETLSHENVTWGAPHIANELALLGHEVAETTVAKYMVKRTPDDRKRQTWRAFLKSHMSEAAACDFLTLPTLSFKVLHVFVVISHDRRRIVHVNVNQNPTSEWTAQQLREAFPCGTEPTCLHRDRDAIYGETFRRVVKSMGIQEVMSSRKAPWQNPFVERVMRKHSPRVYRPHHSLERTPPASRPHRARRVLQRKPDSPFPRRQHS